ncbi:substrate-binding periplasmic protein [Silvanigrella aquatica]|uniref:Solute-binding protein family 3/N-terminal domain-containing protein n=1 Tax=Silvanigrella aquatica TaxID=1915309 RepID=A0A1L4D1Z6_9BACT|nr:transporter substrate-binding domain-containing protein [Silvanigrella aquatica]APJ04210.1 hypothetical protein AXG55_09950 [Silvanigrella aquatica]
MIFNKFNIKLLILFLFIFNIKYAFCSPKIDCFKKFKIALYNYGYFYSVEKDIGIDKDLALELQKRSHCQIEIINDMPRIRTLKSIEAGFIDFTTSSILTPEREFYSHFIFYNQIKNFALVRKEVKTPSWNVFMENKNLKFGVVRGYKHGTSDEKIEILNKEHRVIDYAEPEQLYEALKKNEVQAILSTTPVYHFQFKKIKNLESKVVIYDWNPQENYVKSGLMLSKKVFYKEQVVQWEKLVNEMISDGTMYKIFRKYLPEKEAKSTMLK